MAIILTLADAKWSSEIHALDVRYMMLTQFGVTFDLGAITKTSSPGKQHTLHYPILKGKGNSGADLGFLNGGGLKPESESQSQ